MTEFTLLAELISPNISLASCKTSLCICTLASLYGTAALAW